MPKTDLFRAFFTAKSPDVETPGLLVKALISSYLEMNVNSFIKE